MQVRPDDRALRDRQMLVSRWQVWVIRGVWAGGKLLPVYPGERTSPEPVGMSQRCYEATSVCLFSPRRREQSTTLDRPAFPIKASSKRAR